MINTIPKLKLMVAFIAAAESQYGQALSVKTGLSKAKTYTTLYDLLDKGLLSCRTEIGDKGERKRELREYYQLTNKGEESINLMLKDLNLDLSNNGYVAEGSVPELPYRTTIALIKVMASLAQENDFIAGGQLTQQIGSKNNVVYPMLRRLNDAGFVDIEVKKIEHICATSEEVKHYKITDFGFAWINSQVAKLGLAIPNTKVEIPAKVMEPVAA